jgi:DNA helicase-2/ATP-dependent DNA helicase PcrA
MANEEMARRLENIGHGDHSITSEHQIFGPPGTGKTTESAGQVRRAAKKFGTDHVFVTSFSRAAAAELAGHDLPISPDRISTLHSQCYYALGRPTIAEAQVKEWRVANPDLPITPVNRQLRLEGNDCGDDNGDDSPKRGDLMLQQLNRYRGLMRDPDRWPVDVREFERKWLWYKRAHNLLDFCDLIEICLHDVVTAPGRPAAIFADEAQDLSVLQLKLIRAWGAHAEYFVLALDDDQAIYSFTGVSPDAVLDADIPEDHKIILEQSHRVPIAVHRFSEELVRRLTKRQEKTYLPRPELGAVHRLSSGYKTPEYAILSSAMKHLDQGKKVMFLASCAYMLRPLLKVLRKNAIPFHNPYRKSNGYWNPIRLGKGSSARRVLSLLAAHPDLGESRPWTSGDILLWVEWLRLDGVVQAGAKERLQASDAKQMFPMVRLSEILEPAALRSFLAASEHGSRALVDWWRARVTGDFHDRIQFPVDIAAMRGPGALVDDPSIVVGTIHSVKGGQADVVYLFPDLSRAGDAQYQIAGAPRDSVIRLFYVGATRARETLYICGRETARAISI